jgi:hypothetical protein
VIDQETRDRLISEDSKSAEIIKPFLAGRDVKRYGVLNTKNYLILFPKGITNNSKGDLNPWDWVVKTYPSIADWLLDHKEKAEIRYDKGDYWWELRACDYYPKFEEPKILYQVFQVKPCFVFDNNGVYGNNSIWILPLNDVNLLGILNSKLGWFLISNYCTQIQNGYQLIWKYLQQIPIPLSLNSGDNQTLEQKVNLILHKNEELESASASEKNRNQQHISSLDREIDQMVYKLYGLTDDEIKIVESAIANT